MPHIPKEPWSGYEHIDLGNGVYENVPGNWYPQEKEMWLSAVEEYPQLSNDETAKFLYDAGLFSQDLTPEDRMKMLDMFDRYVEDTYNLDISEIMDWDDYREWYGLT